MRKVTITYRPFRRLKFKRYIEGNFPSTWEETNPKQLIAIACLSKQSISDVQFLSIMTGLSKRTINKLDDYQRFQLIELFDTFHSDIPYNEFIIKDLSCKQSTLFSPKPKLKGLTFGQFIFIDTYFADYQKSSKQSDLNRFIAATYLPYKHRFTEELIETNYKCVEKIDLLTKEAIIINYHLIRDWLCKVYPLVFQKESENTEETKKKPKQTKNNVWLDILDTLIDDDIINQDKYSNLTLHYTLRFLSKKIKANLKK